MYDSGLMGKVLGYKLKIMGSRLDDVNEFFQFT
jgi:hypothetical protein